MNRFTIAHLAQFSGIKQHTIRIWEQRYNALQPGRSEGNTRYYDDKQLRRLLNIVSLLEQGHKVSELCVKSDKELFQLVGSIPSTAAASSSDEYFISQLLLAGMAFDDVGFDKIFAHCLMKYPVDAMYGRIIYPLLQRLGLMWASNQVHPAQEHFISNLLRQKLFTAIDALPPPRASETWLCFLPEGEFHEIGLLFASYLLRAAGKRVVYLGSNVPLDSLSAVRSDCDIDYLLVFLVKQDLPAQTKHYLKELAGIFRKQKIYVAARQLVAAGQPPARIEFLVQPEDLSRII